MKKPNTPQCTAAAGGGPTVITRLARISRRKVLLCLAGVACVLAPIGAFGANPSWPLLKKGDILVTRNPRWANPVPGYYNHVAIYNGREVIEAQVGGNAVRKTSLNTFYNTYPIIVVRRSLSPTTASRMADFATGQVGQRYVQDGYTCVKLLRAAYYYATRVDPYWWTPDHLYGSPFFRTIGWK